jgi:AcrR family transcriptional regulator/DNA-binding MarR family transcriptional regulator
MVRAKRASRSGAPASVAGERLRLGPNGLERAQVVEFQRARILGAMSDVVLEMGAPSVTVAHVVSRAGVSRRTFYEIFADREECFLAALEDGLARIAAVVVPAYEGAGFAHGQGTRRTRAWQERIRAALVELLGLFDEDPGLGRLVVVESLAAGPRALARRNIVLERLIAAVDEGRTLTGTSTLKGTSTLTGIPKGHSAGAQADAGSGPPALTAEGVVGAVGSILYARLAACSRTGEADHRPLIELTGPLMSLIVLPYLGKSAAGKELARPTPQPRAAAQHNGAAGYPFRDLGMRLTYRTLRVLDAVARNPQGSNRLVGDVSGIADQGQISKLLARLQRLGLIENVAGAAGKGAANAWRLTEKGQSMQRAIDTPRGGWAA